MYLPLPLVSNSTHSTLNSQAARYIILHVFPMYMHVHCIYTHIVVTAVEAYTVMYIQVKVGRDVYYVIVVVIL